MNKFAARSNDHEFIDDPAIPFSDWELCLRELNTINTWLGGHAITLKGVGSILKNHAGPFTVAEIGCGGGDNLKAIFKKYRFRNVRYIGIDINKACTDFAELNCKQITQSEFICSDYRRVEFGSNKPDIIFNSLFCHHFSTDELVEMMRWMKENSKFGFFINDLQRHPLAYHSIKILTRAFSKSYLVKHDAPVSVLRGFKEEEWQKILNTAGIYEYSITWHWAFRYLVLVENE